MAKPVPTSDQIAAIEADVAGKANQQTGLTESAALQDPIIAEKQKIDDAFSALFSYYNDDIIKPYDDERRAIEGVFVPSPVVEADIVGVGASPPSGRLVPTPPATDIVRIDEFDAAGYIGFTDVNEQQHILGAVGALDLLQNGASGSTPSVTMTSQTASSLDASSTTLDMLDATGPMSFSVGDVFVVSDGSNAAVVEVTGVTDNAGGDPPYSFSLDIGLVVPPASAISSGADVVDSFNGFTNSERDTKIASDSDLQPILDGLISQLETALQDVKARISEQLAALSLNQDPDGVAQIATATTEASDTDTFITNYLTSTDVSDTGITAISSELSDRTSFLTTRLSEITANYTGQTEDYYEMRYSAANDRGNTQRGTLRELSNAAAVKSTLLDLASGLQGSIDALGSILP